MEKLRNHIDIAVSDAVRIDWIFWKCVICILLSKDFSRGPLNFIVGESHRMDTSQFISFFNVSIILTRFECREKIKACIGLAFHAYLSYIVEALEKPYLWLTSQSRGTNILRLYDTYVHRQVCKWQLPTWIGCANNARDLNGMQRRRTRKINSHIRETSDSGIYYVMIRTDLSRANNFHCIAT